MFEFSLHNGVEDRHGSTTDFLHFLVEVSRTFNSRVAALFLKRLLDEKSKDLEILRLTRWNFELILDAPDDMPRPTKKIILRKVR